MKIVSSSSSGGTAPVTMGHFLPASLGGLILSSGTTLLLDGTAQATSLAGAPVTDASNIDKWGIATMGVAADQPFVDAFNLGFGPAVIVGGGPDVAFGTASGGVASPSWLSVPSFPFSIPFTIAIVCRVDGGQPGILNQAVLLELSTNIAAAVGLRVSSGVSAGTMPSITVRGPGGTLNADVLDSTGGGFLAQWLEDNFCRLIIIKCDGTTITLSINGVDFTSKLAITGTAPGTGAIPTSGTIGADHAGANSMSGAFGLVAVWPRITSSSEDALTIASARTAWMLVDRTTAPQVYSIANAGDSIMEYNFMGNYTSRLAAGLGPAYFPVAAITDPSKFSGDTATSGATLSAGANQILANYNSLKGSILVNGKHWMVYNEGGVNDIQGVLLPTDLPSATSGAATLLTLMKALVTQEIADLTAITGGPHLVVVQTISYGSGGGSPPAHPFYETCASLASAAFVATFANNAFGTAYVLTDVEDLRSDVVLGQGSKHTAAFPFPNHWHCDTLHWTYAMNQRAAAHARAVAIANNFAFLPPTLVSIAVTPGTTTIGTTGTRQFAATGIYSDGSTRVLKDILVWSSASSGVATVSNFSPNVGLATATGLGTSTITALDPITNISGTGILTVAAFVPTSISALSVMLEADLGITLTAGKVTTWTDQSGQGNNATSNIPVPYVASGGANGHAYLHPSYVNLESMGITGFSPTAPFEYFIVFDGAGDTSNYWYLLDWGTNLNAILQFAGSLDLHTVYSSGPTFTAPAANVVHVVNGVVNTPGVSQAGLDGAALVSGGGAGSNAGTLTIFGTNGSGAWGGKGYAFYVFSGRVLTALERANMNTYIANVFGP